MNKSKYIFILISILFLCSCSSSTKNDLTLIGLKGKVKSSEEKNYQAKKESGKWICGDERQDYHRCYIKLDNDGNYREIKYLDSKGNLALRMTPKREKGKIVEEIFYNERGEVNNVFKYNFISDNEIETKLYAKNVEGSGKIYRENGRNVKCYYSYVFERDTIVYNSTWEYNKDGRMTRYIVKDKTGKITTYERYEYLEYDKEGNWTKKLIYNKDNPQPQYISTRKIEYY